MALYIVRNNGPPERVRLPPPRKGRIRASEVRWWEQQNRKERAWRELAATQAQHQQGEAALERLAGAVFALLTSEPMEKETVLDTSGGDVGSNGHERVRGQWGM